MAQRDTDKTPRAVCVGILKGGFGKTTTALNLARELAHRNERALLVDLDDNGHLTLNLGHREAYQSGSGDGDENHAEAVLVDEADPRDYVVDVAGGLDLFPSHAQLEEVESTLKSAVQGSARLKQHLVEPLLGDEYDYIVVDCPANRGKLNDNAMYATGNLIIPLRPELGYETGLDNTVNRLVKPARRYFDLDILAVVPSDLQRRIDQATLDQELLREITTREGVASKVPSFAYISEADWDAIANGEYDGGLPGIRHRDAINNSLRDANEPLRDYDPDCDQLEAYDELARIVERGEVIRDE
ncbi:MULTISPECIES: ParA family protein [Halobacterium]|uniref:ParA family protein n=1 Tax=Halobacterium TaxID=2239 RepID=UPI00073F4BA6|nr:MULTISPECIES: ParA family protein [Halobacterium]MCG1004931.1 ParA family protein [Halobacterium noricense]